MIQEKTAAFKQKKEQTKETIMEKKVQIQERAAQIMRRKKRQCECCRWRIRESVFDSDSDSDGEEPVRKTITQPSTFIGHLETKDASSKF